MTHQAKNPRNTGPETMPTHYQFYKIRTGASRESKDDLP